MASSSTALYSVDVLHLIFHQVLVASRQDLGNATLVCKTWNSVAQPMIDRRVNITFSPNSCERNDKLFARLENVPKLRGSVREICVRDWYKSGLLWTVRRRVTGEKVFNHVRETQNDQVRLQLDRLERIIPTLEITKFKWAAQAFIPEHVLACIKSIPSVMLEVLHGNNSSTADYFRAEISYLSTLNYLAPATAQPLISHSLFRPAVRNADKVRSFQPLCSRLHRLELVVHESALDTLASILPILDKVRVLKLHAQWTGNGQQYQPKSIAWMTALPQLENLQLTNFCICDHQNEEIWTRLIRDNQIHTAHFSCPSFLSQSMQDFTNLRTLRLYLDSAYHHAASSSCCPHVHSVEAIQHVLSGFESLDELELMNGTRAMNTELLTSIGAALRSLVLCEIDSFRYGSGCESQPVLPFETLMHLGLHFRRLRHLTLDIPGQDALLLEWLEKFALNCKTLNTVRLNIPKERPGQFDTRRPVNYNFCEEVWRFLQDRCRSQRVDSSRIENFSISVGALFPNRRMGYEVVEPDDCRQFDIFPRLSEHATCQQVVELRKHYREDPEYLGCHLPLSMQESYAIEGGSFYLPIERNVHGRMADPRRRHNTSSPRFYS